MKKLKSLNEFRKTNGNSVLKSHLQTKFIGGGLGLCGSPDCPDTNTSDTMSTDDNDSCTTVWSESTTVVSHDHTAADGTKTSQL